MSNVSMPHQQVHNLLAASGFDSVDAQLRQMLEQQDGSGTGSSDEHDYDNVDEQENYDYYIGGKFSLTPSLSLSLSTVTPGAF